MDMKTFAKTHKQKTGYSLRSEQVSGEKGALLTQAQKETLLAECRAFDAQYVR